jgi:hypothetical protein
LYSYFFLIKISATSAYGLFLAAILIEFGFNWGLKVVSSCILLLSFHLFLSWSITFFYGSGMLSYSLPAASINSSSSKLYPISSISQKSGVNTSRRSGLSFEISILFADIYPSPSEPRCLKISLNFWIFIFSTSLLVLSCVNTIFVFCSFSSSTYFFLSSYFYLYNLD